MKLHLPKLLCVAVMGAMALPAMGGELTYTTDANGNTLWNVGEIDPTMEPYEQYTYLDVATHEHSVAYDINEDGKIEANEKAFVLDGKDQLGIYLNNSLFVGGYDYTEGNTYNPDNPLPNSLYVNGTIVVKDSACISLGGLYKTSSHKELIGLMADNVIVEGTSGTNITVRRGYTKNLIIKSGTVYWHQGTNDGNSSGSFYWYDENNEDGWKVSDSKMMMITESLQQSGGTLIIGRADKTAQGSKYFANLLNGNISLSGNGKMTVYGDSITDNNNLQIKQSGNSQMCFRDMFFLYQDNSVLSITQDEGNEKGNPTMILGRLEGKLPGFGSWNIGAINRAATVNITQNGGGEIKLAYGSNFGKASTINITQNGTGTVTIGGGHAMANTTVASDGFMSTNTTYTLDQSEGSGSVNIASDASISASSLKLNTAALLNIAGSLTLNEGGTFEIAVNSAHDAAISIEATGSLVATNQALSLSMDDVVVSDMIDTLTAATESCEMTYTIDLISSTDKGKLETLLGQLTWEWEGLPQTAALAADTLTTVVTYDYIDSGLVVNDMGDGTYMLQAATNWNVKVTEQVPEPATATLSLLALAGLAARRRRR
ncbi:MAG: PEP-CTERM sorting domain-containing protein [Akkermansia sp.]|nr:PEP-CTERM sorting domain-containing protein [Akkermansia sp.]